MRIFQNCSYVVIFKPVFNDLSIWKVLLSYFFFIEHHPMVPRSVTRYAAINNRHSTHTSRYANSFSEQATCYQIGRMTNSGQADVVNEKDSRTQRNFLKMCRKFLDGLSRKNINQPWKGFLMVPKKHHKYESQLWKQNVLFAFLLNHRKRCLSREAVSHCTLGRFELVTALFKDLLETFKLLCAAVVIFFTSQVFQKAGEWWFCP